MSAYDVRDNQILSPPAREGAGPLRDVRVSPLLPAFARQFAGSLKSVRSTPFPATVKYFMRGKKISDSKFIVWSVTDRPDTGGVFSGFYGNITDIVIVDIVSC